MAGFRLATLTSTQPHTVVNTNLQKKFYTTVSFNEVASAMFDYIAEEQSGLFIGEEWYEWEQIKHLFEDYK